MNWPKNASKLEYQDIVVMEEFIAQTNNENKVDYELWMPSTTFLMSVKDVIKPRKKKDRFSLLKN